VKRKLNGPKTSLQINFYVVIAPFKMKKVRLCVLYSNRSIYDLLCSIFTLRPGVHEVILIPGVYEVLF
jgi:hypothetical protein